MSVLASSFRPNLNSISYVERLCRLLASMGLRHMSDSTTSLIEAVRERNHSLVADLLDSDASSNGSDKKTGDSILAIASQSGDARVVGLLLDSGADPNFGSISWPLDIAAGCGHLEIVELLLDSEAEVDAIDEDGGTALESAACAGHHKVVTLLLEAGANPKRKGHSGKPAIIYAAERGHEEIVAELMPLSTPKFRQQAELILKLSQQGPPTPKILTFFEAAEEGNLELIDRCLNDGMDIEAMDTEGRTALCKAAECNQADAVKLLVEHGANVKHVTASGACPLEFAFESPTAFSYLYTITPKTLISKSAKVLAPWYEIVDERLEELHRKMGEQGSPSEEMQAYLDAARDGHLDKVETYLKSGGKVDVMDSKGNTALMWAAHSGELEVVKHLVAGADVNHVNVERTFALFYGGIRNKCFVYFFLQPLTEKVLRDLLDSILKSRNLWWI